MKKIVLFVKWDVIMKRTINITRERHFLLHQKGKKVHGRQKIFILGPQRTDKKSK